MTSVTHQFVILASLHFSYPFACSRGDKRTS